MTKPDNFLRDIAITRAVLEGQTLRKTGEEHGIIAERVRQIVGKKIRQLAHPSRGEVPDGYRSYDGIEQYREDRDFWLPRLALFEENIIVPPKVKPGDPDMSLALDELNMTVRTTNILLSEGIKTLGDLAKHTTVSLSKIPFLKNKGIMEVIAVLTENGISLSNENEEQQNERH